MIKLNLLPKNLRQRVEPGWWRLSALVLALAVLGLMALLHYAAYQELNQARLERDALRAEVEALRPFIAEQNRLQQERKALEELLAIRETLAKNAIPWSENLALLINQIPRPGGRFQVALKSLQGRLLSEEEAKRQAEAKAFDGKEVRVEFALQGEALGDRALAEFIRAFERSPQMGIEFQGASLDQNSGLYTFTARVGLTGGGTSGR